MTQSIKKAQRVLDERLLENAITGGYLPADSGVEDLTNSVRQRMCDGYVLRDAITSGYLPADSRVEDLTNSVRQRMLTDENLKIYLPDGSISPR